MSDQPFDAGLDRAVADALATTEAHLFAIGFTVIELMASGTPTVEAITEMSRRSGESFEFVRSATIDTLQREIGERANR